MSDRVSRDTNYNKSSSFNEPFGEWGRDCEIGGPVNRSSDWSLEALLSELASVLLNPSSARLLRHGSQRLAYCYPIAADRQRFRTIAATLSKVDAAPVHRQAKRYHEAIT
ncbi:hypothetical protein WOLCODRAFT_152469 [Wolfiporia cocos MD-104 SS10]|uniref:Uncharacterized protein n=1 Tax=Wolfiporia cocos (strain MD-104) TaxID=742152 RepID=A0A2H3JU71_WOLCO|nr:hypothetical protein WOLCODRAFT_152469 [Wolfiporia cocos MD-104 SS10]